jgi:hypothetical protein
MPSSPLYTWFSLCIELTAKVAIASSWMSIPLPILGIEVLMMLWSLKVDP